MRPPRNYWRQKLLIEVTFQTILNLNQMFNWHFYEDREILFTNVWFSGTEGSLEHFWVRDWLKLRKWWFSNSASSANWRFIKVEWSFPILFTFGSVFDNSDCKSISVLKFWIFVGFDFPHSLKCFPINALANFRFHLIKVDFLDSFRSLYCFS